MHDAGATNFGYVRDNFLATLEQTNAPLGTWHEFYASRRIMPLAIQARMRGLLDVVRSGVPVLGYLHWTLLDNFEWVFGYGVHLGLYTVDRTTFARTAKPSATVYGRIATSNRV